MNCKRSILFLMLAAAYFITAPKSFADNTNAALSYKKLDDFFQTTNGVNESNLLLWMFVSSTNKSVHATNITLTIQSASQGTIPIQIDSHGRIFKFPRTKELLGENPPIISNQPKGSLALWIQIQIPMTNWLDFHYTRLGDGVAEMNKVIKAQAGWTMSWLAPTVDSVIFYFPKSDANKAKLTVLSASGKKEFTADNSNRIKLKLEKSLISENPEVQLSEKPSAVAPDVNF